jgi:7-carboxy-7-deazaguanine synthase
MPEQEPQLTIHEIYRSVQGESTWAGLPCTFVRLTFCDLRCTWCDTAYAFYDGHKMPLSAILDKVRDLGVNLVEVTGGEPLLQPNVLPLMKRLCDAGHQVLIETSGSHDISVIDPRVIRIMDLKCPDSGMCDRNLMSNIEHLRPDDEVKFVIASRADYEWARDQVRRHTLDTRVRAVLFSVVFGRLTPRELVDWILQDGLPVRFQLQMHKIIWPPDQRGV